MILHHYDLSPFAEKIRLMLGASGLTWHSLKVPALPPRPATDPLTGGYRRIPVAQVGADLFCDSEVISSEISRLSGMASLDGSSVTPEQRELITFAEKTLFFDAIASVPPKQALARLRDHLSWFDTARFIWDRLGIARETGVRDKPAEVARRYRKQLQELETQLWAPYLSGSEPGAVDFALYHPLWFATEVGERPLPASLPRLGAWYNRMKAIGHGKARTISSRDALSTAAASQPRTLTAGALDHPMVGRAVRISPVDYARTATDGTLAGATDSRWVLRRDTKRFGTVHVHFPRHGYRLHER